MAVTLLHGIGNLVCDGVDVGALNSASLALKMVRM